MTFQLINGSDNAVALLKKFDNLCVDINTFVKPNNKIKLIILANILNKKQNALNILEDKKNITNNYDECLELVTELEKYKENHLSKNRHVFIPTSLSLEDLQSIIDTKTNRAQQENDRLTIAKNEIKNLLYREPTLDEEKFFNKVFNEKRPSFKYVPRYYKPKRRNRIGEPKKE